MTKGQEIVERFWGAPNDHDLIADAIDRALAEEAKSFARVLEDRLDWDDDEMVSRALTSIRETVLGACRCGEDEYRTRGLGELSHRIWCPKSKEMPCPTN